MRRRGLRWMAVAVFAIGSASAGAQTRPDAGLVDARDVIDGPGAKQLASLPGLPELRAQLLALFLTPATSLVRLLNTPGGQLARVIDAHRDKQQGA